MKKLLFILFLFFTFITNAQIKNIQVNNPSFDDPNEVTIAINYNNPNQIVAGSNLNYFYSSEDGGNTWTTKTMDSQFGFWGDPCLVYDKEGNLYFGHLSNPNPNLVSNGYWIDRIVVQKSIDDGKNFSNGVGVGYFAPRVQDKEWIAVDLTESQYSNNIYMAWTEFDKYGSNAVNDSTRIRFSYSDNKGETFSEPIVISDKGGNCLDDDETVEGAVPCVGPNGEVYVSWAGPHGLQFDRSYDGGKTFGKDIFVDDIPGGWAFNIPGIMRCNGMPITACDISNSENRGNIYINWSDQRNGSDNTDIFFTRSTDGGNTWEETIRVNDDNTQRHQFFTWMTIDSKTGYIYIVYYDRRNTKGSATDVYLARSSDGGKSFTNHKISESSFIPTQGIFFGDYSNIAALNGKIYPIWTRLHDGVRSVQMAIIEDKDLVTNVTEEDNLISNFQLDQNYPNPFNSRTNISFSLKTKEHVKLEIVNTIGKVISVLVDEVRNSGSYEVAYNAEGLSSGIYIYKLTAGNYVESKKMVYLK